MNGWMWIVESCRKKEMEMLPSNAHLNWCVYISSLWRMLVDSLKTSTQWRDDCGEGLGFPWEFPWMCCLKSYSNVYQVTEPHEKENASAFRRSKTFTLNSIPFNLHVFYSGNQFWLNFLGCFRAVCGMFIQFRWDAGRHSMNAWENHSFS